MMPGADRIRFAAIDRRARSFDAGGTEVICMIVGEADDTSLNRVEIIECGLVGFDDLADSAEYARRKSFAIDGALEIGEREGDVIKISLDGLGHITPICICRKR